METIRTSYFQQPSPLLPYWIPPSGLFVQLLRCVLDNHILDALNSVIYPYLLPNYVYVTRLDSAPPDTFQVRLKLGASEWTEQVSLSKDSTDIYDRPDPFAWYDGEWLVVFNLNMGSASGGSASTGLPHPLWTNGEVGGMLISLSNHLVGGRAIWRPQGGVWRNGVLESRGLFVPGSYVALECRYERRPPYPSAKLLDAKVSLQWRPMWSRGDDLLRLYALPRRVRSLGSAIGSIRGKLPGIAAFAIASELGLVSFVPRVPIYASRSIPQSSGIYSTYGSVYRRVNYPSVLSSWSAQQDIGFTDLILMHGVWVDTLHEVPLSPLVGEVA